jgi:hypothetical protein
MEERWLMNFTERVTDLCSKVEGVVFLRGQSGGLTKRGHVFCSLKKNRGEKRERETILRDSSPWTKEYLCTLSSVQFCLTHGIARFGLHEQGNLFARAN